MLPASLDCALAWSAGEVDDDTLAASGTFDPGAIFAVDLVGRHGWRLGLEQAAFWWGRGAGAFVTATSVPTMLRHYSAAGCRITHFEPEGRRWRLWADAPALLGYFGRIAQNRRASAGVTSSR